MVFDQALLGMTGKVHQEHEDTVRRKRTITISENMINTNQKIHVEESCDPPPTACFITSPENHCRQLTTY